MDFDDTSLPLLDEFLVMGDPDYSCVDYKWAFNKIINEDRRWCEKFNSLSKEKRGEIIEKIIDKNVKYKKRIVSGDLTKELLKYGHFYGVKLKDDRCNDRIYYRYKIDGNFIVEGAKYYNSLVIRVYKIEPWQIFPEHAFFENLYMYYSNQDVVWVQKIKNATELIHTLKIVRERKIEGMRLVGHNIDDKIEITPEGKLKGEIPEWLMNIIESFKDVVDKQ